MFSAQRIYMGNQALQIFSVKKQLSRFAVSLESIFNQLPAQLKQAKSGKQLN